MPHREEIAIKPQSLFDVIRARGQRGGIGLHPEVFATGRFRMEVLHFIAKAVRHRLSGGIKAALSDIDRACDVVLVANVRDRQVRKAHSGSDAGAHPGLGTIQPELIAFREINALTGQLMMSVGREVGGIAHDIGIAMHMQNLSIGEDAKQNFQLVHVLCGMEEPALATAEPLQNLEQPS